MTVSKDQAIKEWINCHGLMGGGGINGDVLFNFLGKSADSFAIVPIPGQAVVQAYVDGSSYKKYDFALQTMQPLSRTADDTNTGAMTALRRWQEWIEEQERVGNYPEFGERCSAYRLVNNSNMPQLAASYTDEHKAKYQFAATLYYMEV